MYIGIYVKRNTKNTRVHRGMYVKRDARWGYTCLAAYDGRWKRSPRSNELPDDPSTTKTTKPTGTMIARLRARVYVYAATKIREARCEGGIDSSTCYRHYHQAKPVQKTRGARRRDSSLIPAVGCAIRSRCCLRPQDREHAGPGL